MVVVNHSIPSGTTASALEAQAMHEECSETTTSFGLDPVFPSSWRIGRCRTHSRYSLRRWGGRGAPSLPLRGALVTGLFSLSHSRSVARNFHPPAAFQSAGAERRDARSTRAWSGVKHGKHGECSVQSSG